MPIKERVHALCELFTLIKAYITCPEEIYEEGREVFEDTIIENILIVFYPGKCRKVSIDADVSD